jgi:membrane protease YdiL (CAAX protease family)
MLDGKVVSILSVYLISPLVEELVFRGLVQTRLRKAMSAFWAVLLSALLFSAVHLMTGSVMTVIFTFAIGLVCALAYEKTGSLLPAIVAHIVCNLCGLAPNLVTSLSPIRQYLIIGALAVSSIVFFVLLLVKPSKMPSTAN